MESIIIYCTLEFETVPLLFTLRFQLLYVIWPHFFSFSFSFILALFHGKMSEKVQLTSGCHYVNLEQLTRIAMQSRSNWSLTPVSIPLPL